MTPEQAITEMKKGNKVAPDFMAESGLYFYIDSLSEFGCIIDQDGTQVDLNEFDLFYDSWVIVDGKNDVKTYFTSEDMVYKKVSPGQIIELPKHLTDNDHRITVNRYLSILSIVLSVFVFMFVLFK